MDCPNLIQYCQFLITKMDLNGYSDEFLTYSKDFTDRSPVKSSPNHSSISWKLSLITSTLVLLCFSVLGIVILIQSHKKMDQRVKAEAESVLSIAQSTLTQPLWVFDTKMVNEITRSMIHDKNEVIMGIEVVDSSQGVIASQVHRLMANRQFSEIIGLPDVQIFETDLLQGSQKIGQVRLAFSTAFLQKDLQYLMLELLMGLILMAVLSSLCVFLVTRYFLSVPLANLVEVAHRIEQGDYSVMEAPGRNEFQILARAFASACGAIRKRDWELKGRAENLEIEVALRTAELDAQRMHLVNSSRLASLGEVSAGIAHEINNPLAVIAVNAEMIHKMSPEGSKVAGQSQKILTMVGRITKIVKGLRTFARDGSKDPMGHFQLAGFFDEIKALCQARIQAQNIDFTIDCPEDMELLGREVQISQVIINLINNSVDALGDLPAGEPRWIRLKAFRRQSLMVFRITDAGKGIPPEVQAKIMQPFFTTKDVGKGTGLGLSISVGIMRDHGGDLVYCNQESNTTFEVTLPLPEAAQKAV